uniref:Uncharacterized protein n=1 Tax=Glossina pallidipes TaxID=7398 RepID=A0A1B0AAK3_GLOPL
MHRNQKYIYCDQKLSIPSAEPTCDVLHAMGKVCSSSNFHKNLDEMGGNKKVSIKDHKITIVLAMLFQFITYCFLPNVYGHVMEKEFEQCWLRSRCFHCVQWRCQYSTLVGGQMSNTKTNLMIHTVYSRHM